MITVKEGADVDIGANPSAEEQEETLEEGTIQVNNVINAFRLQETSFDKKSYTGYLKKYMKTLADRVQERNPDINIKEWQDKIMSFSKNKIFNNFKGINLIAFRSKKKKKKKKKKFGNKHIIYYYRCIFH